MVFGEQNSLTLSTKKCFQKCFNHQKTRHHFASFRSVDKTARIICSFSCYVVYLDINILINQPRSVNLWSEKQVGLQCTYTPAHCILVFFYSKCAAANSFQWQRICLHFLVSAGPLCYCRSGCNTKCNTKCTSSFRKIDTRQSCTTSTSPDAMQVPKLQVAFVCNCIIWALVVYLNTSHMKLTYKIVSCRL